MKSLLFKEESVMNNALPLVLRPFGTLQFVPYVTDFLNVL